MKDVMEAVSGYQILMVWGAAVTAGWLGSQAILSFGLFAGHMNVAITTLWLIGALVPVTISAIWTHYNHFEWIMVVWPALGVSGILLTYAVALEYWTVNPLYIFGVLWFAGPALGFYLTAWYVDDWSTGLYVGAGVLNTVAAIGLLVQNASLLKYYFLVAAVLQGPPMLYHGYRGKPDENGS